MTTVTESDKLNTTTTSTKTTSIKNKTHPPKISTPIRYIRNMNFQCFCFSPNCFNIPIDGSTDSIQNGGNCMPFIRSAAASVCAPGKYN